MQTPLRAVSPEKPRKRVRAKGGTKPAALSVRTFNRVRGALAVTIPAWAAAFGWLGGSFFHDDNLPLAYWAYGLVLCIYVVSLPHVIEGLKRITNVGYRDALFLGIVTDTTVVSAETFVHFGNLGAVELTIAAVVGVVGLVTASYANYVAFSHH